jgi:hypothetical protein
LLRRQKSGRMSQPSSHHAIETNKRLSGRSVAAETYASYLLSSADGRQRRTDRGRRAAG